MRLSELLARLSDLSPVCLRSLRPDAELCGVHALGTGAPPAGDDFVCLCTLPALRALPPEELPACPLLVLGPVQEAQEAAGESVSDLAVLPGGEDLLTVYSRISDLFLSEHRFRLGLQAMSEALLSDRGLQHILDEAYRFLRNPIFVSDLTNKYLASVYDESSVVPGSPFASFLDSDILYKYIDERGKSFIRQNNLDEILARTDAPYRLFHTGFGTDALFSSIRVHNVVVGKIFTVAIEHPLTPLEEAYFARLVDLVGQELQKNDAVVSNRYENESLFLADLLTGSHSDPEVLARCLSSVQFVPQGHFYTGVLLARGTPLGTEALHTLQAQLKGMLPSHLTAILDGRLVILFNFPAERGINPYLTEQLRDFTRKNDLVLALSNEFSDLRQLRRHYDLTVDAAELGRRFLDGYSVIPACDTALLQLLTFYLRRKDLAMLIHPSILAIREHDRRSGTEYLKTLSVFLDNMCSSQQASAALHIHKNTLLYRINKLSGAFGIDLSSGEQVLRYQISLRILDLLTRMDILPADVG